MYYVYLLYSKKFDRFYIGQTSNVSTRIDCHNSGLVKSTKGYRPWELVWKMGFESRLESMGRERKMKNLKSQKRIIAFIQRHGNLLESCSSEFLQKIREST